MSALPDHVAKTAKGEPVTFLEAVSEALWEETASVRESVRPGTESLLVTFIEALETAGLVVEGTLGVRRLGLVLRPR